MLIVHLLKKEIRTRMRGKTIFIIENIYLLFLTAIVSMIILSAYLEGNNQGWKVGRDLFHCVNIIQILILVFVSPSMAASALTLEKEQKTYDLLITTPVSPGDIILSKLIASISYFFIMALIALPAISISFILGGISVQEILLAYLVTGGSIVLAGLIGLYLSCVCNRTIASVPISGIFVVSFLILTTVIYYDLSPALGSINPILSFNLLMGNWTVKCFNYEIPFWIPYLILTGLAIMLLLSRSIEMIKVEEKRNLTFSQIILLFIFTVSFTFFLGSIDLAGSNISGIKTWLSTYLYLFFSLAVISTNTASGVLGSCDRLLLKQSFLKNLFSLRSWFGGGVISRTKFSLLVVIAGTSVFSIGIQGVSLIKDNISIIILTFSTILTFVLTFGLLGRFLSINRLTRGKFLPGIISNITLIIVLILPLATSTFFHRQEEEISKTPIDLLLFFSPIKAISTTIDANKVLDTIPYCQDILGNIPFAAVTSIIYLFIVALLWIMNALQDKKVRE